MDKKRSLLSQRKKIVAILVIFIACFAALIGRTAWLQIVQGEELKRAALEQQTTDNTVSAKRGAIYDRNFKVLASNITVETISIYPANLRESISKNSLNVDKVAADMAGILEMEAGTVADKINKQSSFEYIKKKVEKDVADALRDYIAQNKLNGISFVNDVKRFYPYNNLASHLIGFVGNDNQGLEGIESVYDDELSGVPGRVVSTQQTTGLDSGSSYESYIDAQDGNSVVLTIDEVIQSYVEKNLENARIENKVAQGAAAIVMDVNTGEILAMSTKPDYDLNAPFAITEPIKEKYPNAEEELKALNGTEYNKKFNEIIQVVRRNKAVVDSYEPGSTFKSVVASMALETGACTLQDVYNCGGSIKVLTETMRCANTRGHGSQTFAQAVQNSCNPAFVQIGQKIGADRFLEGVKAFGFFEETGIELPGETAGISHDPNNFTIVDLAVSSFGQSFNVTPLQMVTAVSAIANGGKLLKPHLIKEIVNSDKGVVSAKETEVIRQVISEETSKTMCGILESVVSEGGGKNAYLAGYRIAGKTGTSEKIPRGNGKYIASFIGFAPADDPQVVCLVLLDEPNGASYYGGQIAAPVVKNILEETLQYLGVEPEYSEDEREFVDIEVPDVTGKSKADATKLMEEQGLKLKFKGDSDLVTDQIPKAHTRLAVGSTVIGYTDGSKAEKSVEVPKVIGESPAAASSTITSEGLNAKINGVSSSGTATCVTQSPEAGTLVEPGTVVILDFQYSDATD